MLAHTDEETRENVNTTSAAATPSDSEEKGETPDDRVDLPKKSFKFKLTVFMLCMTSVVVAMDSVVVAATLPAITVALKGESLEAFWVGTSYLLSQTVSIQSLKYLPTGVKLRGRRLSSLYTEQFLTSCKPTSIS
jgi:hypothetical protein